MIVLSPRPAFFSHMPNVLFLLSLLLSPFLHPVERRTGQEVRRAFGKKMDLSHQITKEGLYVFPPQRRLVGIIVL